MGKQKILTAGPEVFVLKEDGAWNLYKPPQPILTRWSALTIPHAIVRELQGLFHKIGVKIRDTGEKLTCIWNGDQIEVSSGIHEASVDFIVKIYSYQAERLASKVEEGNLDQLERFRIMREILLHSTSGERNVLHNPLVSNRFFRLIVRGKTLIHLYLPSPDFEKEPDATFTLAYVRSRWLVIPELYGEPARVFRVTVDDAQELQRHLFKGMEQDNWLEWLKIALWYTGWRKRVEVRR